MTGGDESIAHSVSQTPGPPTPSLIRSPALEQLTWGHSITPTPTFISNHVLSQFAGHLEGVMGKFS